MIYIYMLAYSLAIYPVLKNIYEKYSRLLYTILVFIPISLIIGCRKYSIGTDTEMYFDIYKSITGNSFLWEYYDEGIEIGNRIIIIIADVVFGDAQGYILLSSIIMYSCFGLFFYRNSKHIWMSVVLFMGIGFMIESLNIIRQMISISILVNAYPYIVEKKKLKAFVVIVIATLFHAMSLLFIPLVFCTTNIIQRNEKKAIAIMMASCLILVANGGAVFSLIFHDNAILAKYIWYMESVFGEQREVGIEFLRVIVYITLYLYMNKYKTTESYVLRVCLMLASFFTVAQYISLTILYRVVHIFSIFACIAVPYIYSNIKNRHTKVLVAVVVVVASAINMYVMLLRNGIDYQIFM